MAAVAHIHTEHQSRQHQNKPGQHENVARNMSSTSGDRLPSYLPEDTVDAALQDIPSTSQERLLNLDFTSSEELGDLYRSSSSSSNQRLQNSSALGSGYPSYLPESDEETEVHGHDQLSSFGRAQDINYNSQLTGDPKLQARSGKHKTDTRKPPNGVKKSVVEQFNQGKSRTGHISQVWQRKETRNLSGGLGSLSSYLSTSVEDEVDNVPYQESPTASSVNRSRESPQGFPGSLGIHESVGRPSLVQRTQSGESVDSCQSAKTAFAQELASRESSLSRASSKNSSMDHVGLSAGTGSNSTQQQIQVTAITTPQTPMQTHTNTPPMQIPVPSSPGDGGSSMIVGSSGNQVHSLGPVSGWSFHLPGHDLRVEMPKPKPSQYGTNLQREEEKPNQDRSLLRSILPSQSSRELSEEELVQEAKMAQLRQVLTLLVQENSSYINTSPDSLVQLLNLIFQHEENEPADPPSVALMSLRSMISQSLGTLHDMLSTESYATSFNAAGNEAGAMGCPASEHKVHTPASQSGQSLMSTIIISQPEAAAGTTNEQRELLNTLQSATAWLSLVPSEQTKVSIKAGDMLENGQLQQHHHTRLVDILEQLCRGPQSLKQVLVGAAYCRGKCKEPCCMLADEVLCCLVECVKDRRVLRCQGCTRVLSHLLNHVPRCTERRCPVPYCVHLQTGTPVPSSVEEAVGMIDSEIISAVLSAEVVARTSDPNFQWQLGLDFAMIFLLLLQLTELNQADPGVTKLEPVLPLGTFGRTILAHAQDRCVTVKQMDVRCLDVLRRLDHGTPHIIQFFWVQSAQNCQEELQVCAAFEQGGSLQSLLTDSGGVETSRLWGYLHQVVQAVVHLHRLDIVYLAWTADNIVLDSSHQQAKLSNLSYAVPLEEEPDEEACIQAITGLPPQVLAPEVHNVSVHHSSDIWGLGCLLYQLREGRLPYPHLSHEHPESIRQKIAEEGELPQIPEWWTGEERTLLEACWQEEPTARPSAQELQHFPLLCSTL